MARHRDHLDKLARPFDHHSAWLRVPIVTAHVAPVWGAAGVGFEFVVVGVAQVVHGVEVGEGVALVDQGWVQPACVRQVVVLVSLAPRLLPPLPPPLPLLPLLLLLVRVLLPEFRVQSVFEPNTANRPR